MNLEAPVSVFYFLLSMFTAKGFCGSMLDFLLLLYLF